jgi:hypothetical protein
MDRLLDAAVLGPLDLDSLPFCLLLRKLVLLAIELAHLACAGRGRRPARSEHQASGRAAGAQWTGTEWAASGQPAGSQRAVSAQSADN